MKSMEFHESMISAILEGRKTMTRRCGGLESFNKQPDKWCDPRIVGMSTASLREATITSGFSMYFRIERDLPYAVGDVVYVQEEWAKYWGSVHYKADGPQSWGPNISESTFQPASTMPEWAARIWLRITVNRVERLQDITEEDAVREGMTPRPVKGLGWKRREMFGEPPELSDHWTEFRWFWEKLYPDGPESWDNNPWVAVYTFERTEKP